MPIILNDANDFRYICSSVNSSCELDSFVTKQKFEKKSLFSNHTLRVNWQSNFSQSSFNQNSFYSYPGYCKVVNTPFSGTGIYSVGLKSGGPYNACSMIS